MASLESPAASTVPASEKKTRPEKPDEGKFKDDVAKAEKEHAAVMEQLNAIKSKLDLVKPSSKDSPVQQRQQELRGQLSSIRQQQQQLKSSKGNLQERIRHLDTSLKSRIAEQKAARARVPFKNVDEIDGRIQQLEKQVDSGTMKLVDEKKALAEISSLRKQRKGFAQFDEAQKGIDENKAQLAELRKGLDDPEAKALSEKYTQIAKELDEIKAEQDEAYKNINSLRDERSKLQAEQQQKYAAIRAIKDQYYGQKKAYMDYENELYKARKEKHKAEREAQEKERRRKVADQKLEEASQPAYLEEIITAESLIRYFDPTFVGSSTTAGEKGKFAAQASRTVDGSDLKGTRVVKKDDREESYFVGTGGKKGRKGRKNGAASSPAGTPTEGGKFNLTIGVIEEFNKIDLEPPMSQADVPAAVEKLKEKLNRWKADQEEQTNKNIEKARKEIERLEAAEAHEHQPSSSAAAAAAAAASSSSTSNSHARRANETTTTKKPAVVPDEVEDVEASDNDNVPATAATADVKQTADAVDDAAEGLEKTSLENKTEVEGEESK